MTFTIEIDDEFVATRIKSEIGRLISVSIDDQVRAQFAGEFTKFRKTINEAVAAYLNENLTVDVIKKQIDTITLDRIRTLVARQSDYDN